jgi:hypothetical protein
VSDVWFEGGFEVEGRYIRRLIVLGVEVWDEQKECCGAACRLSDLRGKEDDSACLIDVEAEGGENWRGCGCVRKEVSVVHRLRFGGDSQIRTLQVVWTSWRETQLGRNQLERLSRTGTGYIVRDRYSTERVFSCL